MTATTLTAPTVTPTDATHRARTAEPRTTSGRRIWRTGAHRGPAVAAVGDHRHRRHRARGRRVARQSRGKAIPLLGFAQMTFVAAMIGTLLAVVLSHRRATRPHHTFVVTTLVLTALSIVPDVLADAAASTRLTLALTHVVAAAIVIPALAFRALND